MTVDCIIVGGGVIGMMTAYGLNKLGMQVQVLDKGEVGKEASWAGGGILSPLYPWEAGTSLWPLISESQSFYPKLCEELYAQTGIDPQWQQTGLLNFDDVAMDKVEEWATMAGVQYSSIYSDELHRCEPNLDVSLDSGINLPDVAQIRNPRLISALRSFLNSSGVRISEGVEVLRARVEKGKVCGVTTSQGDISCQNLVIAAGAWSGEFMDDSKVIKPVRGQMLRIEVPQDFIQHILLKDDLYIIPRKSEARDKGSQSILIGSTLEYVGFDKNTTQEAAQKLYQAALSLVPDLKKYPISQQWMGLRPATGMDAIGSVNGQTTKDSNHGLPMIAADESTQGLFYNTGHFRNGILLAPASSRIIVSLISRSEGPNVNCH